jgi:BMFP domain-containing protein YqiC
MQKDSKLFDDMARMATNATGALFDMKREIEAAVASQIEKFMDKTGAVSREEFDAVRVMATKAREENEALRAELETLKKKMK